MFRRRKGRMQKEHRTPNIEHRTSKCRIRTPVLRCSMFDVQAQRPALSASLGTSPGGRGVESSGAYFNCVIPLSFIPEHSELGHLPGPTGLTDLKTLAIARLICNNIAHIKSFWIMQGVHLSQIAQSWGCDDLDGTVVWYDITKRQGLNGASGGGTQRQEMHVETLKKLIRDAG